MSRSWEVKKKSPDDSSVADPWLLCGSPRSLSTWTCGCCCSQQYVLMLTLPGFIARGVDRSGRRGNAPSRIVERGYAPGGSETCDLSCQQSARTGPPAPAPAADMLARWAGTSPREAPRRPHPPPPAPPTSRRVSKPQRPLQALPLPPVHLHPTPPCCPPGQRERGGRWSPGVELVRDEREQRAGTSRAASAPLFPTPGRRASVCSVCVDEWVCGDRGKGREQRSVKTNRR